MENNGFLVDDAQVQQKLSYTGLHLTMYQTIRLTDY